MEKSFKTIIDSSKSVLVLLPVNPVLDQVAAALALYLSLEGKKDVSISCPSQMRVEFNRLVSVDRISDEIGSKNLVVKFVDYPAEDIERVTYDVEQQQFRLTVIPKPQVDPPKKDQVMVTYSGVSAETTVLIGGNSAKDFPALSTNELAETKLIHIGVVEFTAPEGRNIISLARPASSVSEILAEYIKELEGGFHPDIASNLLAGIFEGSKNFTDPSVNSGSFKLASDLMHAGGKYEKIEKKPQFDFQGPRPKFPFPMQPQAKGIPLDSPEEDSTESPVGETTNPNPPKSWLQPKIYKGTSVS